eukprot:ANDGO_06965.mRNA.1 1-phosphatidylinositol 3-phosphate 5-kinase fab1
MMDALFSRMKWSKETNDLKSLLLSHIRRHHTAEPSALYVESLLRNYAKGDLPDRSALSPSSSISFLPSTSRSENPFAAYASQTKRHRYDALFVRENPFHHGRRQPVPDLASSEATDFPRLPFPPVHRSLLHRALVDFCRLTCVSLQDAGLGLDMDFLRTSSRVVWSVTASAAIASDSQIIIKDATGHVDWRSSVKAKLVDDHTFSIACSAYHENLYSDAESRFKEQGDRFTSMVLLPGVAFSGRVSYKTMPSLVESPRILLLSFPLVYEFLSDEPMDHSSNGLYSSVEDVLKHSPGVYNTVSECIASLSPSVLFVSGPCCRDIKDALNRRHIAVVESVSPVNLLRLSVLTQGTIINSKRMLVESDLKVLGLACMFRSLGKVIFVEGSNHIHRRRLFPVTVLSNSSVLCTILIRRQSDTDLRKTVVRSMVSHAGASIGEMLLLNGIGARYANDSSLLDLRTDEDGYNWAAYYGLLAESFGNVKRPVELLTTYYVKEDPDSVRDVLQKPVRMAYYTENDASIGLFLSRRLHKYAPFHHVKKRTYYHDLRRIEVLVAEWQTEVHYSWAVGDRPLLSTIASFGRFLELLFNDEDIRIGDACSLKEKTKFIFTCRLHPKAAVLISVSYFCPFRLRIPPIVLEASAAESIARIQPFVVTLRAVSESVFRSTFHVLERFVGHSISRKDPSMESYLKQCTQEWMFETHEFGNILHDVTNRGSMFFLCSLFTHVHFHIYQWNKRFEEWWRFIANPSRVSTAPWRKQDRTNASKSMLYPSPVQVDANEDPESAPDVFKASELGRPSKRRLSLDDSALSVSRKRRGSTSDALTPGSFRSTPVPFDTLLQPVVAPQECVVLSSFAPVNTGVVDAPGAAAALPVPRLKRSTTIYIHSPLDRSTILTDLPPTSLDAEERQTSSSKTSVHFDDGAHFVEPKRQSERVVNETVLGPDVVEERVSESNRGVGNRSPERRTKGMSADDLSVGKPSGKRFGFPSEAALTAKMVVPIPDIIGSTLYGLPNVLPLNAPPTKYVDLSRRRLSVVADEPSSAIAYVLASPEYRDRINSCDPDSKFKFKFSDSSSKSLLEVTVYSPLGFFLLRQKCISAAGSLSLTPEYASEENFIQSLVRGMPFSPTGGKSKSNFYKTWDDRFVLKEIQTVEMDFARQPQAYLDYMDQIVCKKLPSALVKIVGVYAVKVLMDGDKHAVKRTLSADGSVLDHFDPSNAGNSSAPSIREKTDSSKRYIMVMENVFYDSSKSLSKIYDLKGSERNRFQKDTNSVQLDENLLYEIYRGRPLFMEIWFHDFLTTALRNDTLFLSNAYVMDYSLLVGIRNQHHQTDALRSADPPTCVVGIIDYVRLYTFDKKVESAVKASGLAGGQRGKAPTVIAPPNYRNRFLSAMERYFAAVPNRSSDESIDFYGFKFASDLEVTDLDESDPNEVYSPGRSSSSQFSHD